MIKINNTKVVDDATSIEVKNGKVYIDGKEVNAEGKEIVIYIEGNLNSVKADVCESITVKGSVDGVKATIGDVAVQGDVRGDVKTLSGDVKCGNVDGDVETMSGDVTCGSAAGNIKTMSGDINIKQSSGNISL